MTQKQLPNGVWPVMLTAFNQDLSIDWQGVSALSDWYCQAGVQGLFAVSQSSEMFALSVAERIQLAAYVVSQTNKPVVAAGAFATTIEEQATLVKELYQTGVKAVVLLSNQFANQHEDDTIWKDNLSKLLDLTDTIPLGLYECPKPYKRVITPGVLEWAAKTGRFIFHKDTCLSKTNIQAKIHAVQNTKLGFYNAEMSSLLFSLQQGGNGFSGIAANLYPELIVWLTNHYQSHLETARQLQYFLSVAEYLVENHYPTSAKYFLNTTKRVTITSKCRIQNHTYDEHDRRGFQHLNDYVVELSKMLPKAMG